MAGIVEWTLEDRSLLSIRARGHFNRTLPPLEEGQQLVLEVMNYGLALLGVGLVFLVHRQRLRRLRARYQGWLAGYQMAFDTSKSKLTKSNFAMGYKGGDIALHTSVNDGSQFNGSVHHKVNPKVSIY